MTQIPGLPPLNSQPPRSGGNKASITMAVSRDEAARWKALAARIGIQPSVLAREVCLEYLAQEEAAPSEGGKSR